MEADRRRTRKQEEDQKKGEKGTIGNNKTIEKETEKEKKYKRNVSIEKEEDEETDTES